MADVSNREDILDVRDIIERVEELREERDDLDDALSEAVEEHNDRGPDDDANALQDAVDSAQEARLAWAESDEARELTQLEGLLDDMKGYGGDHQWEGSWYPVTLIRDSYFEDFARDEAEQLSFIKSEQHWPANHIDWEKAAAELQQDYSQIDFDGVTYWHRT